MSEIQCPLCNAQSPENALFCQHCGQPLKCQDCGANLLPTARACIQCGKLIPEHSNNDQFQVGMSVVPPGYNRLKFHEAYAADVRDLDLTVSDHAITQIGAYIGDLMPSFMGTHLKGQKGSSVDHQAQNLSGLVEATPEIPPARPQLPPAPTKIPSNTRAKKSSKTSSNTRAKKSSKKTGEQQSNVDAIVAGWVSHPVSKELADAIDHSIIVKLPLIDRALLALYGIYRTGYEQEVPFASMVKYLYDTFNILVQPSSLSTALYAVREKKTAKASYLNFVDGQGYKITPSGRKYIEDSLKVHQAQLITTDGNTGSNGAAQP